MAFPEDRLSTQPVEETYIPPDGFDRSLNEDKEMGPFAIGDASQGVAYQEWHGTYDGGSGDITLTPAITLTPVVVLTIANLTELSFAFDSNGNIAVAYRANGIVSLYWFDTDAGEYVTTPSVEGALSAMVCNDDKRVRQSQLNDVLIIYTKQVGGQYILHQRRQRDRYSVEIDLVLPCWRYVWKVGMHEGLRVQIITLDAPPP